MGNVGRESGEKTELWWDLLLAASCVRRKIEQVCQARGLTFPQFAVLRILKCGPPEGYPRRVILERMIERAADCTRLIDRLERRGFVERHRTRSDRRLSLTRITGKGLQLLASIEPTIRDVDVEISRRISRQQQQTVSRSLRVLVATPGKR